MRILLILLSLFCTMANASVRLKSIAHLSGLQENPLTGYGLVTGLAGTGDSRRSKDTTQAISNLLQSFGVTINARDINSRNSATVIITVNLPPFAHEGDKLDINVASLGDARSLAGGTLLVTPLKGADNAVYALAQGPVSVGGFRYDALGNVIQKNHPTTGIVPGGALVTHSLSADAPTSPVTLHLILNHPDFSTASAAERALNLRFGAGTAMARSAQDIEIHTPPGAHRHFVRFVSEVENLHITPDHVPVVVVNERTGIVIAGSEVRLEAVTISHGNLQISIATEYRVSQPLPASIGGRTVITPATGIEASERVANTLQLKAGASIAELMQALSRAQTSTRDTIAILESLRRAGALHAEIIIE